VCVATDTLVQAMAYFIADHQCSASWASGCAQDKAGKVPGHSETW
jgi:hypothetical protein